MNTASVKVDDIVKVDIRGRIFYAFVTKLPASGTREFGIRPIDNKITWRHATSRQIKGAWYKSRQGNGGNA